MALTPSKTKNPEEKKAAEDEVLMREIDDAVREDQYREFGASDEDMHDWAYLRDNPAGEHKELWYHEQGDRSWLVVTRNTLTHDIIDVKLARDEAKARGRSR